MATREQQRAQLAYACVAERMEKDKEAEYKRFSKRFPALIQTCGLAQALAFAEAKEQTQYLKDLACVAGECNEASFTQRARGAELPVYQKLSRDGLAAATWLKRYAEALLKGDEE